MDIYSAYTLMFRKPMKIPSLIVVVVVLALMATFRWLRSRRAGKKFKTTDELIQWLANQAVEDARRGNDVGLDYSVDSIKKVEQILGKIHDQYVKNPSSVSANGLGSAYGAYVGEAIRRSEPSAKWERDDPAGGEKSYPLIWRASHSYPLAWCFRRITNGPEDNIWNKYQMLRDRDHLENSP
jgi:type II secretory pathway pseudopilin PulG